MYDLISTTKKSLVFVTWIEQALGMEILRVSWKLLR
jgi:hypothetical protein